MGNIILHRDINLISVMQKMAIIVFFVLNILSKRKQNCLEYNFFSVCFFNLDYFIKYTKRVLKLIYDCTVTFNNNNI